MISAKIEHASQLAERYIKQGKGKKSLEAIYFRDFLKMLGGEEVPAFYNAITEKLHITSDLVGMIAHEALHYYSSPSFKAIFGHDIDEGMTQYLTEEIENDYNRAYSSSSESGFLRLMTDYTSRAEAIKTALKASSRFQKDVFKGYFKGDRRILKKIKSVILKAKKIMAKS